MYIKYKLTESLVNSKLDFGAIPQSLKQEIIEKERCYGRYCNRNNGDCNQCLKERLTNIYALIPYGRNSYILSKITSRAMREIEIEENAYYIDEKYNVTKVIIENVIIAHKKTE